jgi:hypothetical protein
MQALEKDYRESLEDMAKIVEKADIDVVKAELEILKQAKVVTIKPVKKQKFKIGNNSYEYNSVAN